MIKDLWAKISYYWFLFMLGIVGFFCGVFNVDGATINKSSDQWALQFCSDRTCDYTIDGSDYFRDYATVNSSSYTNNNHYYLTAIRLKQTFNSSNYLQSGTQYQLRYKLHFNPKYNFNDYSLSSWRIDFTTTDTSNNQVVQDDDNYTCSFTNINNSDTAWFLTCTYTPTANLKQVYIRITFPFYLYTSASDFSGYIFKSMNVINYTSSSITYSTGTIDAVNNQTTIIQNQTNEINNSVNNVNDSINNSDIDNPSSDIADMQDMLPSNGVITQLITLPITLYTKVLNSINGTCQQFNLGNLYGTNLIMPCIEVSNYLGNIWNVIDLIISGAFVLVIARKMIKAFEGFTSMKEGDVIND